MTWITNLKLKAKLLSAFGSYAVITVVVGAFGQSGITKLYALFQDSINNNLFALQKSTL